MGTVLEAKLAAAFKFFDLNGDGKIDRDELSEICKQLNCEGWTEEAADTLMKILDKGETGYIDYTEFAVWLSSGIQDGRRVMSIYESAAAKMPGERLADGDLTDVGHDKIRTYLNNILDLAPNQYATPKATTKLTWLRDVADLLDPSLNPGGFRICQNSFVDRDAIGPLLELAQRAQSDAVVVKSLEVLARAAFGNTEGAAAIARNICFLPALHSVLANGKQPEKLAALQLAQAITVCAVEADVQSVLSSLLQVVSPMLSETSFAVLPLATFDVLVSMSFCIPADVVQVVPWVQLASWSAESHEAGRPAWLQKDNLTVLAGGLLAANVLSVPMPLTMSEEDIQARQMVRERSISSDFLEYFALAMEAAVMQREWPAFSGAYHTVSRLAPVAIQLASLGFRKELVGVVNPLAKAVEINPDERTTRWSLLALRALVDDLSCLESFLVLEEFRCDTLEVLHKAGDEMEATDLLSCTCAGENALAAAQAVFDDSKDELQQAPSVRFLAQLFNEHSPMDGELTKTQILQVAAKVPLGPSSYLKAALSGSDKSCTMSFTDLAQHVYGTPTMLGWWPSLMEDTARIWNDPTFQQTQPPSLQEVLFYYEMGSKGSSGISSHDIFHEVLPSWGQSVVGELLEDLFAEIRGDVLLSFKDFAVWMRRFFQAVDQQCRENENMGAVDQQPLCMSS